MAGVLAKVSSLWVFSPVHENFDKLTPSFVHIERQTVFHCHFGAIDGSLCLIIIVGPQESDCKIDQASHRDRDKSRWVNPVKSI